MLLTGSLEAFRVQDLLGLVGRKPGQWLITMRGGPRGHAAFIGLRDRAVVAVSADTTRQELARRLVIEGAIGTTGLAEALRQAGESGVGLVRTLVDSDKVDPALIPACAHAHVVGSLASLTHWRAGSFAVDLVEALPDDIDTAFPVADLGAQVSKLLRRWRPASDLLGGPNTVIAVHPGKVPRPLRGLHALIDGHRTVAELIDSSGHGDIGTIVDLADLVEARCAMPITGSMGALEQRLAMLAALETPPEKPTGTTPRFSVITGGAASEQAHEAGDGSDDLLSTILKGVRGI